MPVGGRAWKPDPTDYCLSNISCIVAFFFGWNTSVLRLQDCLIPPRFPCGCLQWRERERDGGMDDRWNQAFLTLLDCHVALLLAMTFYSLIFAVTVNTDYVNQGLKCSTLVEWGLFISDVFLVAKKSSKTKCNIQPLIRVSNPNENPVVNAAITPPNLK